MELADWHDVVQNAQLLADTHERKAAIKRRHYERQLGMMKVTLTATLILTLTLTLTQTLTRTLFIYPNPNTYPYTYPYPKPTPNPMTGRVGHTPD